MTNSSFKIFRIYEAYWYKNYQCLKCMFIKITKACICIYEKKNLLIKLK